MSPATVAVLGRVLPKFEVPNDLPPGGLSRDPQVEVAYRADPHNTHRTTARSDFHGSTLIITSDEPCLTT